MSITAEGTSGAEDKNAGKGSKNARDICIPDTLL